MLRLLLSLSKTNRLSKVHPIEKIMLFLIPLIIVGSVKSSYWIILMNIGIVITFHIILKSPKTIVLKFTSGILIFTTFTSISMIFDQEIRYIIVLILKSISGSMYILLFTMTTPIDDVFYLGSKYNVTRDLSDIAKSMIRYLILVEDEFSLIKGAMKSRGGFETTKGKIKNGAKVMGVLFVNTMKRWQNISDAVNSRGYSGKTVYLDKDFDFSRKRFAFECIYIVFLILIVMKFDTI